MLWTNQQLSSALGRACHLQTGGAEGFVIDSRQIKPGDIFLPLIGTKQDGHDYIEQVINQGAAGSLCLRGVIKNYPTNMQEKLIASDDIMADIIKLARYRRDEIKKNGGKVLAITGSVGKTSAKEMIGHVLEKTGEYYYKSPANQNNTLGVPLCLINSRADIKAGVYECGMNHRGELLQIGETLRPDIVVITNIRENHIGYLGSLQGIAEAKGELLEYMMPDAPMAILEKPREAKYNFFDFLSQKFKQHHPGAKVIAVGEGEDCDVQLLSVASHLGHGQEIKAKFFKQGLDYSLNLIGAHQGFNSLLALAAVNYLLVDENSAPSEGQLKTWAAALIDYRPIAGRGKPDVLNTPHGRICLIDESYNAAPASMLASLQALNSYVEPMLATAPPSRLAILGDMKELGKDEIEYHQQIISQATAMAGIGRIILVGPLMIQAYSSMEKNDKIIARDDATQVMTQLEGNISHGSIIMVKASHSMGLEKIVKYLQEKSANN